MSLNAYIWACGLPMDVVSHRAYRVLLKYADRANPQGRNAWASTQELADDLGTSTSTINRARRELIVNGLLVEGDQSFVGHIRKDRRPTVFNLNMTGESHPQIDLDGVSADDTSHGVSKVTRGVRSERHGVSTGALHRTVNEPLSSTSVTTEGNRKRRPIWAEDRCPGNWKTQTHELGRYDKCIHCHEKPASWLEATA